MKERARVKRRGKDSSQAIRSGFQIAFLALNVWIGAQFLLWVLYYEKGGDAWQVSRPAGVEGWLPIASLMNLKAWALSGELPTIHPAGLFLLISFLLVSIIIRKSFCSWLCPVGTLSEALWQMGTRLFGRNLKLPRWLDVPLRSLKYILMGLFLYAVGGMSVEAIRAFLEGPYGVVADVKMLNFFRFMSVTSLVTVVILVALSVVIKNFWCRYLCPYGALMGLIGMLSPVRVRRDTERCVNCGKCAQACPSLLPVDQLVTIQSAECTSCYQCVAACPINQAVEIRVIKGRQVKPWAAAAVIAAIFFGVVLTAKVTGNWETNLPDSVYLELVPKADSYSHP